MTEHTLLLAVEKHLRHLQRTNPTLAFRKRHGSAYQTAGDPDLHGVWGGTPFEIELKQPGKRPTPLQAARLAEWQRAGCLTAVVHSLPELLSFLDKFQAPAPPLERDKSREKKA
jgi:hypothetical protein